MKNYNLENYSKTTTFIIIWNKIFNYFLQHWLDATDLKISTLVELAFVTSLSAHTHTHTRERERETR